MKKTLVIGCGGSGLTTMVALNRLLVQNSDILPAMGNDVYYLAIDTEMAALETFQRDVKEQMGGYEPPCIQVIQLSHDVNILNEIILPKFVQPYSTNPNDRGLARLRQHWWFDRNGNPFNAPEVYNLIDGAGQCPPASYGLTWFRLREIGDAIKRIVDRMIERGNGNPAQLKDLNIIVVAGLSGGTGRGCWNLVTFKVREYLLDNYKVTISPIGVFFDASVFDCVAQENPGQRIPLKVNSLTGISELSCWMLNGSQKGSDRFNYRMPDIASPGKDATDALKVDIDVNPKSGAPVRSAYLVCGRSGGAILDKNGQYHEMAGSAIYAMITNPEILGRAVNDSEPFNSLGAATFEVDTLHIRGYFEARARGIALANIAMSADSVSDYVAEFFAKCPVNTFVRSDADLKPDAEGTPYQRAVAALQSSQKIKAGLSGLELDEMKKWKLEDALDAVEPLLVPASDDVVAGAVRKALSGYGEKDVDGVPSGIYGKKAEQAVVEAMKKVYRGTGGQAPSIGRALEFLKEVRAQMKAALATSPTSLQIRNDQTMRSMEPAEAVRTTIKVFSKRTFKDILRGDGAFTEHEIGELVSTTGADRWWGVIPQGIAAVNYPKLRAAFAEAFAPLEAKLDKLIRACEDFAACCREAAASFRMEESTAAGAENGHDAFSHLFATPENVDRTLCDASDRKRFYRRNLVPIVASRAELEQSVGDSILVGEGLSAFIADVVANGTLEKLGTDKDRGTRKRFLDALITATRDNVGLSDNFLVDHFTFEKILDANREFWNAELEKARGNKRRKDELDRMFLATLGTESVQDPNDPRGPAVLPETDELLATIAASLAATCAPWWVANSEDANHSIEMFVPFDISKSKSLLDKANKDIASHAKLTVSGTDNNKGGVTPFSYVAFVSEGVRLTEDESARGMHLLDKVQSLSYYTEPDVSAWLRKAESPDGESIFTIENHNKGIGYVSPIYVHDKKLSSYRWKPWLKDDEALVAAADNEAAELMLYALLGSGLSDELAADFAEKLAPYGWSLPAIRLQEKGQVWTLVRKTLDWDGEEDIAVPSTECSWNKGKKLCTSICNLESMLKGKGRTGKNGKQKESDVEEGKKLRALLAREAELFGQHVLGELAKADVNKLLKARKEWLVGHRDNADAEDQPVYDRLLAHLAARK